MMKTHKVNALRARNQKLDKLSCPVLIMKCSITSRGSGRRDSWFFYDFLKFWRLKNTKVLDSKQRNQSWIKSFFKNRCLVCYGRRRIFEHDIWKSWAYLSTCIAAGRNFQASQALSCSVWILWSLAAQYTVLVAGSFRITATVNQLIWDIQKRASKSNSFPQYQVSPAPISRS